MTQPHDEPSAHEALLQFLYQAPIGLVRTSIDGAVDMLNPMSAQLLLPLAPQAGLDNLFDVLAPLLPDLRQRVANFNGASGVVIDSQRLPSRAGARQPVLAVSLLKLDAQRLIATITDVTQDVRREQQGLARQLRVAERTDSLTGLPNRAALRDHLAQLLAAADEGFALLFVNCDRFRQVNDNLGQAAGDTLLRLMSDRLRAELRSRDTLADMPHSVDRLGRVGGDEFVVAIDDLLRPDDAHRVAQRLVDALAQPYGIGQHQVHCSASIGLVLWAQCPHSDQPDPHHADAVLRDASTATAEAKRAGGGRYRIFEPAMRERAARGAALEAELRVALDQGQLYVVYQPVVDLLPGDTPRVDPCAGVEALVRWQHPVRGVVPPLDFIAVAEECGLIGALGDFVLATASRQFVRWQRTLGPLAPRRLAVNLSRAQLAQPGWVASVSQLLQHSEMAPHQLQLEITESLAAQDEQVQTTLHALKALGLQLALDDFGTGYSSLSSLHLLPVDTVKIDRSFVSQAATEAHHRVLIEATVRVAHSLNMGTVAEGIETAAQCAVVQALGCDKGQGYLFSRPLTAEALVEWLVAQHPDAAPAA